MVIQLQSAKVGMDKDPKDGKPLIKVSTAPQDEPLLLKAANQGEFAAWYNGIQFSTLNSRSKKKLEDFNKALTKLEQETAKTDKIDLISFYSGVDSLLKTEENRKVLFETLEESRPEYRYLRELYDCIQNFDTMCKLGRFDHAITYAQKVRKMLTDFKVESRVEDERDILFAHAADEPNEELPEDLVAKAQLEASVKEMMKSLANDTTLTNLAALLEKAEKEDVQQVLTRTPTGIFSDLFRALVEKLKAVHHELFVANRGRMTSRDFRLLAIPMARYRRSVRWDTPGILRELGMLRDQSPLVKKAASVLIQQSEDPRAKPVSVSSVFSFFRGISSSVLLRGLDKSNTTMGAIHTSNSNGNLSNVDDEKDEDEEAGMLDM